MNMRELNYAEAISEATVQAMEKNNGVFVFGEGVDDVVGIFNTTREAFLKFGAERVIDTPIAENMIAGVALGAGIMGMHPVAVFARTDFMLYAMDQIINHAAKWSFTYGGKMTAPVIYRAIVGRSWGQGPQHSQSLQSLFAHIPGLKVVMPTTAYDAKGLLLASFEEKCPVVFIEHRWLYKEKSDVPEKYYIEPIGKAKVIRVGSDVTIVAISQMVLEALGAAEELQKNGVSAEVIDLRTLRPWDKETIVKSVQKTGYLLIADTGWLSCSISSEIAAKVAEDSFGYLKAPIKRIGMADSPTPSSAKLEEFFYPNRNNIFASINQMMNRNGVNPKMEIDTNKKFSGSF